MHKDVPGFFSSPFLLLIQQQPPRQRDIHTPMWIHTYKMYAACIFPFLSFRTCIFRWLCCVPCVCSMCGSLVSCLYFRFSPSPPFTQTRGAQTDWEWSTLCTRQCSHYWLFPCSSLVVVVFFPENFYLYWNYHYYCFCCCPGTFWKRIPLPASCMDGQTCPTRQTTRKATPPNRKMQLLVWFCSVWVDNFFSLPVSQCVLVIHIQ